MAQTAEKKNKAAKSSLARRSQAAKRRLPENNSKRNATLSAVKASSLRLTESADAKQLVQFNRCLELALNNMVRGLSMFDANQRLIVCNNVYQEIYELPERLTRPGTHLSELVRNHVKRETGLDNPAERKKQSAWIKQHVAALARGTTFTHTQYLKSGRIVLVTNKPLEGGGWVDIQEDITERRQAEQKIYWLSRHDPLT
jgi:PAS domain-containing protein